MPPLKIFARVAAGVADQAGLISAAILFLAEPVEVGAAINLEPPPTGTAGQGETPRIEGWGLRLEVQVAQAEG